MLNIDLPKISVKELIYKVVTSAVFLVTNTNMRNTSKVSNALSF